MKRINCSPWIVNNWYVFILQLYLCSGDMSIFSREMLSDPFLCSHSPFLKIRNQKKTSEISCYKKSLVWTRRNCPLSMYLDSHFLYFLFQNSHSIPTTHNHLLHPFAGKILTILVSNLWKGWHLSNRTTLPKVYSLSSFNLIFLGGQTSTGQGREYSVWTKDHRIGTQEYATEPKSQKVWKQNKRIAKRPRGKGNGLLSLVTWCYRSLICWNLHKKFLF